MALKKTIETEYHIPAEYEDIFNATLSHSDGKTFVAATMRGWQKKAYCRSIGKRYGRKRSASNLPQKRNKNCLHSITTS